MIGLGKRIRVCTFHQTVLGCPEKCVGVELGEYEELQAATHSGCAVCAIRRSSGYYRVLRKCPRRECYGRFRRVPYDDTFADEWIAAFKSWPRRAVRRLRLAA
jgi:hypothetical protein